CPASMAGLIAVHSTQFGAGERRPPNTRRKERTMTPQHPPASLYRTTEGLGLWEHRGKVAAVGVGHSPTARRWDGAPETCVGAWSILALRRAIADAGV